MSRRGNCWDNAVAESFFSSRKKERIRKRIYKTRDLARADVFDYIEVFYNRIRHHGHLSGISPEAFEQASLRGRETSIEARVAQSALGEKATQTVSRYKKQYAGGTVPSSYRFC